MPDDKPLFASAQQVFLAIPQQVGEEITRSDLKERTQLSEKDFVNALSELLYRQWVEHTGDMWRITPLGESTGLARLRGSVDSALSKTQEGTIVLRPPRDRGLIRWSVIAGALYLLLLAGLLVPATRWVGVFLIFFVGVWIGLLFNALTRQMEVARLTPTTLLTRTWYGKTHHTPGESIAQIVLVTLRFSTPRYSGGTTQYMFFLDSQGHCLNWLLTNDIPTAAEMAFAYQFKVPVRDLRSNEMRLKQLREAFPGSRAGRSTGLFLAILAAVLIVLGITILILVVSGALSS